MSWINAGPVWPPEDTVLPHPRRFSEPLCSQLTLTPSPLPEASALLVSVQLAFQQTGWHLDKCPGCPTQGDHLGAPRLFQRGATAQTSPGPSGFQGTFCAPGEWILTFYRHIVLGPP